jgi:predicted nucleic acid-binding protein
MKYLLDTCILSELVNPQPQQTVIEWVKPSKESTLFG